jgi:hypothetical protein
MKSETPTKSTNTSVNESSNVSGRNVTNNDNEEEEDETAKQIAEIYIALLGDERAKNAQQKVGRERERERERGRGREREERGREERERGDRERVYGRGRGGEKR